jgi:hypothetical protein
MTHTSGLRDSLDLGFLAAGLALRPPGDTLAALARQQGVNFAPGEKMIYSNGGYHLLSLVMARAGGMPFEQWLQQRVFEPLGLHDTRAIPSDFELHPGVATLHLPQADGRWRRGMFPSEEVRGEGSIVSTVDDMLRWLAHLREPTRLGRPSSWAQLRAATRLAHGRLVPYGFGLQLEPLRGLAVLQHGGTVLGGSCHMLTVPGHALDVVLMANGAPGSLAELAGCIVEAVLGEPAFPAPPERRVPSAAHPGLHGARYATPEGDMVVGFADAGGSLALSLHNSPPLPLVEEGGALHLPFSRSVTGPYRLDVPSGGPAPEALELDDACGRLPLLRLPEAPPAVAEAGVPLLGRYRVPDLDAQAVIAFEGEALVLRIASPFGPNVLRLTPWAPDLFAWNPDGPLAAMGGTLAVARHQGRPGGLRLHTLRTRHLHFQRLDD